MGFLEHIFVVVGGSGSGSGGGCGGGCGGGESDKSRKHQKNKAAAEMEGEICPSAQCRIPDFSSIAVSVMRRCSRILEQSMEQLQQSFEAELPEHSKQPTSYARSIVEYYSYKALCVETQRLDHLADKEFSLLTFDMMLAWETPDVETESLLKKNACSNYPEVDDDEGSLFYASATRMASQIDGKETVGLEAFTRIAPACAAVADSISVHNLFDALASSPGGRLHFLIYDKYLRSLNKILKSMMRISAQPQLFKFSLANGEIILDIDAKSVLQHSGSNTKSGRLTLTSNALYFEASSITSFEKATMYDFSKDLKQEVKCKLTGPWGARLFDKAIMYKSDSVAEPIFLEFPQFSGHSHRDYWFSIMQEILHVHKFIRKYNLQGFRRAEALSRAALSIFRYRAVKEAFHSTPSNFKSILAFNLAEKLPKGDKILVALRNHLELIQSRYQNHADLGTEPDEIPLTSPIPDSLYTLKRMGFLLLKKEDYPEENNKLVGNIQVGQACRLQTAVRKSFSYSDRTEAARETLDQVKVEDINTNLAVIKGLLFPLSEMGRLLKDLASWEDPFKSRIFLLLNLYLLYRGWVRYLLPFLFLSLAACMFWHKHHNKGKPISVFHVLHPPRRSTVELLVMLQDVISNIQKVVQTGTIALLKLRALLLAFPQTSSKVAVFLVVLAVACTLVPSRHLFTFVLLEIYTRRMPLRQDSSEKLVRRIKEWWSRIPAAPIQIIRNEEHSNS